MIFLSQVNSNPLEPSLKIVLRFSRSSKKMTTIVVLIRIKALQNGYTAKLSRKRRELTRFLNLSNSSRIETKWSSRLL